MPRQCVTAIEVGKHERGRVGVRHDHLGNQRSEHRQNIAAREAHERTRAPRRAAGRVRYAVFPARAAADRPSVQGRADVNPGSTAQGARSWRDAASRSISPSAIPRRGDPKHRCRAMRRRPGTSRQAARPPAANSTLATMRSTRFTKRSPSATLPAQLMKPSCPVIRLARSESSSSARSPLRTLIRPSTSSGIRDRVRTNTVTECPAARALRNTCRPREPVAPNMSRRDITSPYAARRSVREQV